MREELGFDGTEDDVDYELVYSRRPRYGAYIPHVPVDLFCCEPSLTDQSQADDADVNVIMARYQKTGTVPSLGRQPMYGDFTDLPSFMEAQETVRLAGEMFMALPANVRAQFDNDPAAFVDFAQDPENLAQMRLWGLAEPEKAKEEPFVPPKAAEPAKAGDAPGGP